MAKKSKVRKDKPRITSVTRYEFNGVEYVTREEAQQAERHFKLKKLGVDLNKLPSEVVAQIDELAEFAAVWGWERDQGTGNRVTKAEEDYLNSYADTLKMLSKFNVSNVQYEHAHKHMQ